MLQILTVIAPLFLIIFASALLQKFKNIGENWSTVLNEFALKIGLPVLIFSALAKTPFSFQSEAPLIITNSVFLLASFVLVVIIGKILRLKKQMFLTLFICFVFGNVAYLGIPTLIQISGEKIVPTATLIVAIYLFWLFTVGIGYLDYSMGENKKNIARNIIKNLLTNPLLISVILGILIGSLKITLPSVLLKSLDMVTASVTPTVLIVIGLFIGKSKFGKLSNWLPVLLFSILKLAILPAIFYFGVKFSGASLSQFPNSIIQAAMPLAITPFAIADKYSLNKDFIARSIVLSTILSVVSLPFWISILTS
jgi:predicted permease